MDDLIKELEIMAPYLMYAAIAITCIALASIVIRKVMDKRRQQQKAREREANLLFNQLLTPTDLDVKDPIISRQVLTRH